MSQQNSQTIKAYALRKKTEEALETDLKKFKQELVSLRTSQVSSAPQVKLARIRVRIAASISSVRGCQRRNKISHDHQTKSWNEHSLVGLGDERVQFIRSQFMQLVTLWWYWLFYFQNPFEWVTEAPTIWNLETFMQLDPFFFAKLKHSNISQIK